MRKLLRRHGPAEAVEDDALIAELRQRLGAARSAYRGLRYDGPLPVATPANRPNLWLRPALITAAASALVVVTVLTLDVEPVPEPQQSITTADSDMNRALSWRPRVRKAKPSLRLSRPESLRSQRAPSLRLPSRPRRSDRGATRG